MEHAGMSRFDEWRRAMEKLLIGRVSAVDMLFLLDRDQLKEDYDSGLSAERAAEMRVDRCRHLGDAGLLGSRPD